ncbi:DUF4062 domain-containing protein [Actinomadura montaniterrae]|uniref:DUF4062 domain-containing protein n=1 Tax=Actinomadura montaniterrae TaxID=1803903 RepID=UPI00178C2BBF|nr:DUF4062 domain-containing protein [Actinomadura montaniterrae]
MANPRELVVFVASPGDLSDERDSVRRAADYINSLFLASHSTRLMITGWEQSQPTFGRPQEAINPLVQQCDIFIGLLNRKWGTPTGEFSSGFEEEYEQAAKRAKESGRPSVAIFFKEVPDEMLQDAGPSLSKVLEFRKKLETEHIALYRQFSTVKDFELQVTKYLMAVVVDQSSHDIPPSPEGTVDKVTATEQLPTDTEPEEQDEAREQLAATLYSFYSLAKIGSTGDGLLDPDRLLLFSMAVQFEMLSIPIHSMNRIYGKRREYAISIIEYRLIIWTVAENFHTTRNGEIRSFAPGFEMIMRVGSRSDLEDVLVSQMLTQKAEIPVSNGSLGILREMKARPAQLWGSRENVSNPSSSASDSVARSEQDLVENWAHLLGVPQTENAAFNYMSSVVRDSDFSLLKALSDRIDNASVAEKVMAIAKYAIGDLSGICDLASKRYLSEESCFERMLKASFSQMSEEQLSAVILGQRSLSDSLVRDAFTALSRHRAPTSEEYLRLLKSKKNELISLAFNVAEVAGEAAALNLLAAASQFNDDKADEDLDEYRHRLRSLVQTEEELRAELSNPWSFVDAWSALSWLHGSALASEAREILDSDCDSALDETKLEEAGYDARLRTFVRTLLRRSALDLLARIPAKDRDDQDVERFRRELARKERLTTPQAVKGLTLTGTAEDATHFLKLVTNHYGEEKKVLLKSAVKLGGAKIARKMIADSDEETASAGAHALSTDSSIPLSELQSYLYSSHDSVRMEIWKAVENRMGRGELEDYIDEYRSREAGYYYDVVAALDRKLYMPQ